MPRRALECNRETVEAALSSAQREALAELCERFGVSPAVWHNEPAFRCFVMGAVGNLANELQAAGSTREAALLSATVRLGVDIDAAKSWLRRVRRQPVRNALSPTAAKVA